MNIDQISPTSIAHAAELLRSRKISALELANVYVKNIKDRDGEIGAYLEVFGDIEEQARTSQGRIDAGDTNPLVGIPVAVKDNILQKGRIATAGSKILETFKAPYDATVVSKLKEAGSIFLGRTNMDEFAMGSSTEHSAFKSTRNPVDLTRVPGGSSGGSAAAVAMGGALVALGSDTGGSIRQPASFCGVVGFKPTYGSVSRSGLIAMGSSLDVIGPLTSTVADAKLIFDTIRGRDPLDATSHGGGDGKIVKRIGIPRAFLRKGLHLKVLEKFEESLLRLKTLGFEIVDIELPNVHYSLSTYYVLMPAEVSANLSRFDGVKYGLHVDGATLLEDYVKTRSTGFGAEVRRRILLGTYVLSHGYYDAYYGQAQSARTLITADFKNAFDAVDLVATPTTPAPAFKFGEKSDPLSMYLEDMFTVPANITGMPAISVPMGTVLEESADLPVGLQLIAPHNGEDRLFAVGARFLNE